MAADSRINIVLDVDTRNTEQIEATAARLTALGRAERSVTTDTNRLSGRMDQLTGRMNSATGSMNKLNTASNMFIKHARKIMYLVIGLGIEFLAVTAALVSVNAAFAIGNAAVKLYNWGMQAVAGALAAAGAAAITAAAAFTEFNAAAQAFRFKEGPGLGSAISQSADALRMLQVNSTLATYGITALNQAYATFSKNAKLDPKAVKQLEMMADFGTGANREKSLSAAAEYISLIKKNKGFNAETAQLAKQIGPEFEKAAKKYGSASSLLKALESGQLAKDAGVEGFGKTVNQTLMAQLKGYLTKAFVELSDAGRYLLEPVKKTMNAIFGGLMRAFRMVRGDLIRFGRGGLLDALERLSEKTEAFAIKLFRDFLPAAAGWWKRTGNFFKAFVNEFNQARRSLDSMREGGSIVIDMFGKPLVQIFKRIGSGARAFSQLAKNNKDEFLEFGDALKRIVDGFFDIGNALRKAFTAALPIISKVATVVGQVFETLAKVLNFMAMLGPIGATMAVGAMTRFAMKGTRGARYERRMARGVAGGMSSFFGGNMGIAGNMGGGGGGAYSSQVSASTATVNAGTVLLNGNISGAGKGASTSTSKAPDWAYKGLPSKGKSTGDRSYGSSAFPTTASIPAGATMTGPGGVKTTAGGTVQLLPIGPGGQLVPTLVKNSLPAKSRLQPIHPGARGYVAPYGGLEESGRLYIDGQLQTTNGRLGSGTRSTDIGQNRGQTSYTRRTSLYGTQNVLGYGGSGLGLEYRGKNAKVVTAARAESVTRGRALAGRMSEFNSFLGTYGIPHADDPRRPDQIAKALQSMPMGPYLPTNYAPPGPNIGVMQKLKLSAIDKAKNFATTATSRAKFGASLPGNMIRYLYNSVRPGSKTYTGTSAQLFPGGPGGIQGNLGAGGGGGGGGGPLPGSAAPSGPGMGNYVPTTGLRNWASNMMTNMFGPKWTGAPGQSKATGLKNRFGNFMTGGALNQNAAKLQEISKRIVAHGGDLGDFLKNNPDVDPSMAQMAMGKNGKPLGKFQAKARALKMRGSAMGGGMLASIATGMFLDSSMGKKMFSDPAAQASMQTGAMLMPFNPALGLGVGLGGAAWNAKTTAGGAAAGAGSGALLAMAAGGGPATMLAAAAVMATVGMWRSVVNKNKMAREGAKAIGKQKLMDTVIASVAGGIKDGTAKGGRTTLAATGKFISDFEKMDKAGRSKALQSAVDSGLIDKRTAELMSGQGGYGKQAVGQLKRDYALQQQILNPMFNHYEDTMRGLQLATGMTTDEIHKLAAETGVNLYDDTIKLQDAIKGLGKGMMQSADEINTALKDVAVKATKQFDVYLEGKGMEDALQSAQNNLLGGNVTTESLIDFYQKGLEFEQLAAPDTPIENFLARFDKYVKGDIFKAGGQLAGVTPTDEFKKLVGYVLRDEQTGVATQLTTNIGQALADKGVGFESTQGGQTMLQTAVSGLIDKAKTDPAAAAKLSELEQKLKSGELLKGAGTPQAIASRLAPYLNLTAKSAPKVGTTLEGQLLRTLQTGTMSTEMLGALDEGGKKLREEILAAFTEANKQLVGTPEWWTNAPPWFQTGGGGTLPLGSIDKINGFDVVLRQGPSGKGWYRPGTDVMVSAGDTSTPRALRATLGAHSKFNSMLPGKRMITSSWREWGLGSPSSDHATGRAFDLTGDNLQQYAKNITSAGGFAEFHGVNGERHLHVVPPIGPMGDTSTSRVAGAMASGSGATYGGDSFNITVVESKDARTTADEVVKKILDMQKQARRRA